MEKEFLSFITKAVFYPILIMMVLLYLLVSWKNGTFNASKWQTERSSQTKSLKNIESKMDSIIILMNKKQ